MNRGIDSSSEESKQRSLIGFSLTHNCVRRLQNKIVGALCAAGVPAVGVSPFPFFLEKDQSGRPVVVAGDDEGGGEGGGPLLAQVERLLDMGFLPVLHGDGVVDHSIAEGGGGTKGFSVLSGDIIAEWLCERLNPRRLVFLTDVEGVLDRPPPEGRTVLPEIVIIPRNADASKRKVEDFELAIEMPTTNKLEHDVTGEYPFYRLLSMLTTSNDRGD